MLCRRQVQSTISHKVLEVDSTNRVGSYAQGYADDIVIIVQRRFHSTLEELLNYYLYSQVTGV